MRGFFDGINQGAGGVSNVAAQMAGLDTAIGSGCASLECRRRRHSRLPSALDANIDGINAVGRILAS